MNRRQLVVAAAAVALIGVIVLATRPASEGLVPLRIGEDTTRIVGPLDANGLPDYLAVLNDVEVPAPADNAAIPLLRVLGTEVIWADRASVLEQIGAPEDLPTVGLLRERPRSRQEGALASWAAPNEEARSALGAIADCSRFWVPCVRLEGIFRGIVSGLRFDLAQPSALFLRECARVALERGDYAAAMREAELLFHLGRLLVQGQSPRDRILACNAWQVAAWDVLRPIVEDPRAGVEQLERVQDLVRTEEAWEIRSAWDEFARYKELDFVLRRGPDRLLDGLGHFDVNVALRSVNQHFDRALAWIDPLDPNEAGNLYAVLDDLESDVRRHLGGRVARMTRRLLSAEDAGRFVGDWFALEALRPAGWLSGGRSSLEATRGMVSLAVALRLHALGSGGYPTQLEDLGDDVLEHLAGNPLVDSPLQYRRTATGCKLVEEGDPESRSIELPAP